jgi:hypothetical protein
MATVSTPLANEAETIFTDLGYAVETEGAELRAERKWRVVQVTPIDEATDPPRSGDLRCFVTWDDRAATVRRHLSRTDPDYEWAVIGIDEEGDYEVFRTPTEPLPA